jgi:transcriptional regulator with XRE-family HTH domain
MISHTKVRETVESIIVKNNLSYEEFGVSIGISKMMVSYVLAGKRNLSLRKTHRLCEVWEVTLESLLGEDREVVFSLSQVISDIIRLKRLNIEEVIEQSGLDLLTFSQIKRGIHKPTREQLEKLCAALDVPVEIVEEGAISSVFRNIEAQVKRLYLSDDVARNVIRYLEKELKNRRSI